MGTTYGHCDRCNEVGHVTAHPELGCADVGCTRSHENDEVQTLADAIPVLDEITAGVALIISERDAAEAKAERAVAAGEALAGSARVVAGQRCLLFTPCHVQHPTDPSMWCVVCIITAALAAYELAKEEA